MCDAHDVVPFFKDSMNMPHVFYEGSKQSVAHQNFWEIAIGDLDHTHGLIFMTIVSSHFMHFVCYVNYI